MEVDHQQIETGLFERIFYPRAVAVIGASRDLSKHGHSIFRALVETGYKGPLYPVNPRAKKILGRTAYPSLDAIPGLVDYVVTTIPGNYIPETIQQCGCKGVSALHVLSAGFDKELEGEKKGILDLCQKTGVRMIGPNARGIFCAEAGLSWDEVGSLPQGGVGYISQSGGLLREVLQDAPHICLGINKAISVGDGWDLDHGDFLAYYAEDPELRVIGCYVETARRARRFLEVLAKTSARKPVVFLKGGRSELGNRAAESHTGALSADHRLWRAGLYQAGAIEVESFEELTATMGALDKAGPVAGEGVAIVGQGGGATVLASDICSHWGLTLSDFSRRTMSALEALDLPPGCTLTNPIDLPRGTLQVRDGLVLAEVLGHIEKDPGIGMILVHLDLHNLVATERDTTSPNLFPNLCEALAGRAGYSKPLWVTFRAGAVPEARAAAVEQAKQLWSLGVPVFEKMELMLATAARWIQYSRRKERRGLTRNGKNGGFGNE